MGSHVPVRMCVACRAQKPRPELFRLVRPTGRSDIVADPAGKRAGKGFYLCRNRDCLEKLQKERRLRRLFAGRIDEAALAWMGQELVRQEPSEEPSGAVGPGTRAERGCRSSARRTAGTCRTTNDAEAAGDGDALTG